jgi:hypothetical protein
MFTAKFFRILLSIFAVLVMSITHLSATHYGGPPSYNKGNIRDSKGSNSLSTTKYSSLQVLALCKIKKFLT